MNVCLLATFFYKSTARRIVKYLNFGVFVLVFYVYPNEKKNHCLLSITSFPLTLINTIIHTVRDIFLGAHYLGRI